MYGATGSWGFHSVRSSTRFFQEPKNTELLCWKLGREPNASRLVEPYRLLLVFLFWLTKVERGLKVRVRYGLRRDYRRVHGPSRHLLVSEVGNVWCGP